MFAITRRNQESRLKRIMTALDWSQSKVMITGVSGTVGNALLEQLIQRGCQAIVGIDNNESALFFQDQQYQDNENVNFYLCDVTDRESLMTRMRGVDVVIHAAALKHVPICEEAPPAAVNTNIIGIQNIIDAAFANDVKKVLFTSSDKAVNPTNVMGTTKLMGERLITAANVTRQSGKGPVFGVSRFGNVLGSSGSVIPVFAQQIEKGGPVTVTHQDMTRFVMTLEQATDLVLEATELFKGGEVFITKMPVMRIIDLAEVMIEELAPQFGYTSDDIEVKITGPRVGEKMYEELLNTEEVRRSLESRQFFIIKPALEKDHSLYTYDEMPTNPASVPYTSEAAPAMPKEALRRFLIENRLIETGDVSEDKTQPNLKVI